MRMDKQLEIQKRGAVSSKRQKAEAVSSERQKTEAVPSERQKAKAAIKKAKDCEYNNSKTEENE